MLTPQLITALTGIFIAGAVSGATGVALPLIAGPVFLMAFGPTEAIGLTALCSLTGQLFSVALLRRAIAYEFRLLLILPGLCAVPLGTLLLAHCSQGAVRAGLGGLIVVSGFWGLSQGTPHAPRPVGRLSELLVGLAGGLTGGLVGASAVAPVIWCSWQGLCKERQRAIIQPFILVMQSFSLVSLALWGDIAPALPGDYVRLLIPLLLGVASGVACFHAVSSAAVSRAVLSLVTVSGLALLLA
jgi:uncharacterized membrane protein YfcA